MRTPIGRQSQFPPNRRRFAGQAITVPALIPEAEVQPGQPGANAPEGGQLIQLPGANFPPAGSRAVDETGDANIAPGTEAVMVTFVVPTMLRNVLVGIGFGADDETATAFLSWSIRLGSESVPGYILKPAALGSLLYLAEIFVLAPSGATVNIVGFASAAAVVTYRYIARVRGWNYIETGVTP